ncbi:hypothetical protein GCM10009603_54160 [Nocardiopsis exhalans]
MLPPATAGSGAVASHGRPAPRGGAEPLLPRLYIADWQVASRESLRLRSGGHTRHTSDSGDATEHLEGRVGGLRRSFTVLRPRLQVTGASGCDCETGCTGVHRVWGRLSTGEGPAMAGEGGVDG